MSNYSNNTLNKDEPNHDWVKVFNLIDSNSRVLDVGCSSGNLGAELIEKKKCEVVGIDVDEDDIKMAAKRLTAAYVLDVETDELGFLGKYDYIIFADVMEHLVDPSSVLAKVKKLLKQNGKVIFSIPNVTHVSIRLMLLSGLFQYSETGILDKTHLRFFDVNQLFKTFEEAGLRIQVLDPTTQEYTYEVIEKELDKLGVAASKKFYKSLKESNAFIYQFVGAAGLMNVNAGQRLSGPNGNAKSLINFNTNPNPYGNKMIDHIQNLEIIIDAKTKEINDLNAEISKIYDSAPWKVGSKLVSIKRKLKK